MARMGLGIWGVCMLFLSILETRLAVDDTSSGDTLGFAALIFLTGAASLRAAYVGSESRWWRWLVAASIAGSALVLVILFYGFSKIEN